MATKKVKKVNIGKILDKNIKSKGLKKKKICDDLEMSRPTFNSRLIDGEFTTDQIKILKTNKYI